MSKNNQSVRLESLDALRGFDMFFIMGGGAFFIALATLFPNAFFETIAGQMQHVEWHGFNFEDMIFPLFLFIAGISFPYSLEVQRKRGASDLDIYMKIVKRGLTLVILGFVYNGFLSFDFDTMRYCSVLGRIGLAWMFAALIFANTKTLTRIYITSAILIGYWLLLWLVPAPDGGGADVFSMEGSIVGYVDRVITPGRLHLKIHDPEGLLSTVPAVATALLGMFTGEWIKNKKEGLSEEKKTLWLIMAGVALMAIGLLWDLVFPINKNLWTSSFVCYVGGLSTLLFAAFYYVIDVKGYKNWTLFFRVIGLNSITIYMAQLFNFSTANNLLFGGIASLFPRDANALILSIGYVAICWGFLYFLYRQRIFLKV